ncbi:MAG: phosphinothricin acetyltransferase [Sulfitobacter sp.]|jgi:L-amino acid N-acyltransferase YncA
MIIRAAEIGDAPVIARLWNAMIRDTLNTFTTQEKTATEVAAMIKARPAAFWLAEAETCAGFVTYGPFRAGPGYGATVEHSILLAARYQGRGIGRALMDVAEKTARDQGLHIMVAGISGANRGAVEFHLRLGFTQVGVMPEVGFKQGQRLDLVLMQKSLSPP